MTETKNRLDVVQIVRGKFSGTETDETTGRARQNNFSGWDIAGNRWHIKREMAESIGIKKDADFKPFFCIVKTETFNELDADGQVVMEDGVAKTFDRPSATAVFETGEQADQAVLSPELRQNAQDAFLKKERAKLNSELVKEIQTQAKELEVTPETMANLLNTI